LWALYSNKTAYYAMPQTPKHMVFAKIVSVNYPIRQPAAAPNADLAQMGLFVAAV